MSSLPIPTSRGLRPRRRLRTDEGEVVDYRVGRASASASGCVSPVARCWRFVDCAPPALARTATQARYAACHCAVAPWWIAQLSRSLEGCGLDDKEADEPCCAALRSSASPRPWRPLRCASWSTWATGRAERVEGGDRPLAARWPPHLVAWHGYEEERKGGIGKDGMKVDFF